MLLTVTKPTISYTAHDHTMITCHMLIHKIMQHEWNTKFKNEWNKVMISHIHQKWSRWMTTYIQLLVNHERHVIIRRTMKDMSSYAEPWKTCHHTQNHEWHVIICRTMNDMSSYAEPWMTCHYTQNHEWHVIIRRTMNDMSSYAEPWELHEK
jgi:hypothetical protein